MDVTLFVGILIGLIVGIMSTAIFAASSLDEEIKLKRDRDDISVENEIKKQYIQQIKYGGMNIIYCPEDMEFEKIGEDQYIIRRRR